MTKCFPILTVLIFLIVTIWACKKSENVEDNLGTVAKDDGLVAWYILDEGKGEDKSENGSRGISHHVTGALDRHGNADGASYFNGINSYIEISDNDYLSISETKQLTISIWMKPEVFDFPSTEREDYVHWLGKGASGQHEYTFRIYNRSSYRPNRVSGYAFNLVGGLGAGMFFEEDLFVDEWTHVTVVYDYPRNSILIYRDGKFKGASTFSSYKITPRNGTAPLRIGTRDFASYFKGSLDDLKVYNRTLSASEILSLFNE